jgi:hypothetical protein
VPPDGEAVNVSGLPTLPVDGPLIATASVSGEIVIDPVEVAVAELASVTVSEIV